MSADELLEPGGKLLRRRVEGRAGGGPLEPDGSARDHLVAAVADASDENGHNRRAREGRKTKRPLGDPRVLTEHRHLVRPGAPGCAVDLQGDGAAVVKVLDQGERRERVVAHMNDAHPGRAARVVLDGACGGVVLGRFDDQKLNAPVASQQRPDDLPSCGVRRHDDGSATEREGVLEV